MKKLISTILIALFLVVPTLVFAEETFELGAIKAGADAMPTWAAGSETSISQFIIAEYNAQTAAGFDLGAVKDEVQGWNGVVARQLFVNGDNKGNPWGWGATGFVGAIMVSDGATRAFTLKNEMFDGWAALGHFDSVGYPTSNQIVENGKIYQNFSKGYIVCDVDDSTTAELKEGTFTATAPTEAAESEAPQTSDAGTIAYVLMSLTGLSSLILLKKR